MQVHLLFIAFLLGIGRVSAFSTQEVDIVYTSGEDRDPIRLFIPDISVPNSTTTTPEVPLVVLLHGRCMDGESTNRILRFSEQVDERGFILALPEGTRNRYWCSTCARLGGVLNTRYGCRSWAATPACCAANRFSFRPGDPDIWEPVDDVEHISQVIQAVKSQYNVAEDKVFVVGWENGGFMAYRMACEKPDLINGIVSISGLTFADAQANCAAFTADSKTPVNVLHIAGEFDNIPVDGGRFEGRPIPSVDTTLAGWAGHNGCDSNAKVTNSNVLVSRQKLVPNAADTDVMFFGNTSECDTGGRTELRLIRGLNTELANAMTFTSSFSPEIIDWMLESEGVSNNGFVDVVDDDDNTAPAPAPAPSVGTSSGPEQGYTYCPPDVLRCPDGEMVTRQAPTCEFQCSNGSPQIEYLESICTSNDCCGTYGLCLSTSACTGVSCPNDITLDNYDTYMLARENPPTAPPNSAAGKTDAFTFAALAVGAMIAFV